MNWFSPGDLVRCIAPAPFGAAAEVGTLSTVVERCPRGFIRLRRNAPYCNPARFELVRPAGARSAKGTPVERAEDLVAWFAAAGGPRMPPPAMASCLRGMRAIMEAALGTTFHIDGQGQVAFAPLPSDARA